VKTSTHPTTQKGVRPYPAAYREEPGAARGIRDPRIGRPVSRSSSREISLAARMDHSDRDSWDMTLHPLKSYHTFQGRSQGAERFLSEKTAHREGIRHLIPWYLKVYPKTKGRDSPRQCALAALRRQKTLAKRQKSFSHPPRKRASTRRALPARSNGSQRSVFLWNPPSNPLHHLDSVCQQTTR
jgi:hypothetical protein